MTAAKGSRKGSFFVGIVALLAGLVGDVARFAETKADQLRIQQNRRREDSQGRDAGVLRAEDCRRRARRRREEPPETFQGWFDVVVHLDALPVRALLPPDPVAM